MTKQEIIDRLTADAEKADAKFWEADKRLAIDEMEYWSGVRSSKLEDRNMLMGMTRN